MALVAPSGPVRRGGIQAGVDVVTGWCLEPVVGAHAADRTGFLAGSDADRAADLAAAFGDQAIRGVLCLRGGYGVQRVLDLLPADLGRADPKVVTGFSDITALHLALAARSGLASCHSPGFGFGDPSAERLPELRQLLTDPGAETVLRPEPESATAEVVVGGRASGRLLGGNLALIASAVGTSDLPALAGALLLIEDVAEAPYRVDRMLTQLLRSGALSGVAGVAVGRFTEAAADPGEPEVGEVIAERLGGLGVPVLGGLPIGHAGGQAPVPLGVPAVLDADARTLTVQPLVA